MVGSLVWGDVPEGFDKIRSGSRMDLLRADMATQIDLMASFDTAGEHTGAFGRGALVVLRLDGGDALVRRYRHGGALRRLTGDFFLTWPPRPFRELALTEAARARGVPTVEVLAALIEPVAGLIYRGWLVTRRLEGARDLWEAAQSDAPAAKLAHLEAAARAVRAMHRCGIIHRDLNLKNILVRSEGGAARGYIIDFDKSRACPGDIPLPRAQNNLDRLKRSLNKLDPKRRHISAADWELFLRAYREGG
ncbi:MAG TPA: lipopolysaccharide kinase InaA family protein [Candidatus Binatia bacterium]